MHTAPWLLPCCRFQASVSQGSTCTGHGAPNRRNGLPSVSLTSHTPHSAQCWHILLSSGGVFGHTIRRYLDMGDSEVEALDEIVGSGWESGRSSVTTVVHDAVVSCVTFMSDAVSLSPPPPPHPASSSSSVRCAIVSLTMLAAPSPVLPCR